MTDRLKDFRARLGPTPGSGVRLDSMELEWLLPTVLDTPEALEIRVWGQVFRVEKHRCEQCTEEHNPMVDVIAQEEVGDKMAEWLVEQHYKESDQ
jgi:hypothetical protein